MSTKPALDSYREEIEESGVLSHVTHPDDRTFEEDHLVVRLFFYEDDRQNGWSREDIAAVVSPFMTGNVAARIAKAIDAGKIQRSPAAKTLEPGFSRESIVKFMVTETELTPGYLAMILTQPFLRPYPEFKDSPYTTLHIPPFLLVEMLRAAQTSEMTIDQSTVTVRYSGQVE
jgi:hypothetical protein